MTTPSTPSTTEVGNLPPSHAVHPAIERYVTSDLPLLDILGGFPASDVTEALTALEESLAGKRLARDAIRLAQAVQIKGADPELLLLLLNSWADLSCRIGLIAEAEVLVHRAKSLLADDTHPEIVARAIQVESILADLTGDKARRERLLSDLLAMLPSFSPRRKFYVWELALALAVQGRADEMDREIKELAWQGNERFTLGRVHVVQFVNAIETGRTADAARLMEQFNEKDVSPPGAPRLPLRGYKALLALMRDPRPPAPETLRDADEYVRVSWRLLARDTEAALRQARVEADRLGALFGAGFGAFNLIRAELSAGNGVAAIRLLRMRQARGNRHYLDAFFQARAELLAGNKRSAARHFRAAMEAVDLHGARGRLDIELALACEMTPAAILEIARMEDEPAERRPAAAPPAESGATGRAPRGETPPPAAASPPPPQPLLGHSEAMTELRRTIRRFADLDAPVLIMGETGVGKDLVARALHLAGPRRDRPFTPVNCGSITETLLESELFGHERGAFTGAERASEGLFSATGEGTILLDEIGDISPRLQAALLRVLETSEIRAVGSSKTRRSRCRILAATNADLGRLAEEGRFRRDLLFRLQRLGILIPPLRERSEDILYLARNFLDAGRPVGVHARLAPALRELIRTYDWPGNVRELKNVIERMRLMRSDKLDYDVDDLDLKFQSVGLSSRPRAAHTPPPDGAPPPATPQPPHAAAPAPSAAPRPAPHETRVSDGDVASMLRNGNSTLRRMDRLRALFESHGRLTRDEVIRILGVSPNTATTYLRALCDEGFAERVTPSLSTRSHYFRRRVSG